MAFDLIDKNNSNFIEYEEFYNYFIKGNKVPPNPDMSKKISLEVEVKSKDKKLV
jgi:Ca2+-binding EF-hand superfamily protein